MIIVIITIINVIIITVIGIIIPSVVRSKGQLEAEVKGQKPARTAGVQSHFVGTGCCRQWCRHSSMAHHLAMGSICLLIDPNWDAEDRQFPIWRAMDRRWSRWLVPCKSLVTALILLPISWTQFSDSVCQLITITVIIVIIILHIIMYARSVNLNMRCKGIVIEGLAHGLSNSNSNHLRRLKFIPSASIAKHSNQLDTIPFDEYPMQVHQSLLITRFLMTWRLI